VLLLAAAVAGGADWGLAEAVEEGSILGPSVLFTGMFEYPSGMCQPSALTPALMCLASSCRRASFFSTGNAWHARQALRRVKLEGPAAMEVIGSKYMFSIMHEHAYGSELQCCACAVILQAMPSARQVDMVTCGAEGRRCAAVAQHFEGLDGSVMEWVSHTCCELSVPLGGTAVTKQQPLLAACLP
jgi:hypothetical protein